MKKNIPILEETNPVNIVVTIKGCKSGRLSKRIGKENKNERN